MGPLAAGPGGRWRTRAPRLRTVRHASTVVRKVAPIAWRAIVPASKRQSGHGLRRDRVRCLVGTFPHPPRLEPDLRLSPHPAQHFQISLGLCSVAFSAEELLGYQLVCLCWGLELFAGYNVIHF